MSTDPAFIDRLTAQSILDELPSYGQTLELATKGEALRDLLEGDVELPGVVVTDQGRARGVISRGQYLRLVGRQFGLEVYLPRELRLMWKAVEQAEEPLVLAATTPIQQAVVAALQRPRALIYEPVIVSGGSEDLRLIDFPDLLRADSRLSQLRNQQMQQILATVQEGFLLVDPDHRVASEYSASIEKIFERQAIAGLPFPELLRDVIGAEKAQLAGQFLDTLFNRNVIEQLVQGINPLIEVVATVPSATVPSGLKHLAFRFVRGVEKGEIRRVLVRVEDRTRQVELAQEIEAQQKNARERVDLVFDILRVGPAELGVFLGRLDELLQVAGELLSSRGAAMPVEDRLAALLRDLHGLKGEAGLLRMELFQRSIHKMEDRIVDLRTPPARADASADASADVSALSSLAPGLRALRELVQETNGIIEQFRQLGAAVPAQLGAAAPATVPVTVPATVPASSSASPRAAAGGPSTNGFFGSLIDMVEILAARLGKPARFVSHAEIDSVPAHYRDLVRDALIQFVRNSMVHGLEPPEVRRQRGKAAAGTLQFAVREHAERGHLELIYQDDGGGLNLERIRLKAQQKGWRGEESELPMLIFEPGFSTVEDVSFDAGRGVGMDVVRARVLDRGGQIVPHFKTGVFCAFQIVLPL